MEFKFLCGIKLLCFFAILSICIAQSKNRDYYRAAVHEHKQYDNKLSIGRDIIDKNLEKYEVAAALAKSNGVDIIVFPEKGLFPMKTLLPIWFLAYAEDVPTGKAGANPCNDEKFSDRPILRNFSCIAKKHNFYVVATLIDVKKCKVRKNCARKKDRNSCVKSRLDCPLKQFFYFNTLVVFNRKGDLIVRYYKRNPFIPLELGIVTPKYRQPGYFNTEFGSFATAIGLDFLFNDSLIDLEKRPNTSAITLANWWFDHTPLTYFSVAVQQAWSVMNKVTVLSSDVHNPSLASLGSGIYLAGQGEVVYSYNPDGKSKLLISNVPISNAPTDKASLDTKFFYIEDDGTSNELIGEEPRVFKEECGENVLGKFPSSLTDYRCKQTKVEQYTFTKLNKSEDSVNLCSNDFCCNLRYKADSMDESYYFAVSGNPLYLYDIYNIGVQACFLARCEPVGGKPCRNFLLKSNTKFLKMNMTCNFGTNHVYPHLFDSELRLTDIYEWYFDGRSQLSYENLRGKNLLYADMYGRLYNKDGLAAPGKVLEVLKDKI